MSSRIIVGIDPGSKGAIAIWAGGDHWAVHDCPITEVHRKKGAKTSTENVPDPQGMFQLLEPLKGTMVHVFLEKVWGFKGQGGASQFKFGMNYGMWMALIAVLGIPYTLVTPQRWKKDMGVTSDKGTCAIRAKQLFPETFEFLQRKKDHDRAEAILLAGYGRKVLSR